MKNPANNKFLSPAMVLIASLLAFSARESLAASPASVAIFTNNFDSLSGKTAGYSYGDAANVTSVYASGAGVGGSVGARITADFTGQGSLGGAAFQYQNGAVTRNTSTSLTNYILSFDASANRAQGGFQIILQTWSGSGYSGTGPLESKSRSDVTLGASNSFIHCAFNLGSKLAGSASATAHTWQIAFVMDEIYFGVPAAGNQLIIDNVAVTMGVSSAGQIWIPTASASIAHVYNAPAITLRDGTVLVEGGGFGPGLVTSELFDPASETWTGAGSLHNGRSYHSATLLKDGTVLAAGGFRSPQSLADAELYDPVTHNWTVTGPLNESRFGHTATLLPNGTVLVTGGISEGHFLASAEVYDPAHESWTKTTPMNDIRFYHTATLLNNGKVLVAGGNGANGAAIPRAELYDPATQSWTSAGAMSQSKSGHTASLLPSGEVFVVGRGTDIYDPAGNQWRAAPSPSTVKMNHTMNLLPDGRLLVAGGDASDDLVEIFDPATGAWSISPLLNTGRSYHVAALLSTGKVLVAGGHDPNFFPLVDSELFDPGTSDLRPLKLLSPTRLPGGAFQFAFQSAPAGAFSIYSTTNLSTPFMNWNLLGAAKEISPGEYQFVDLQTTALSDRFYRVSSP